MVSFPRKSTATRKKLRARELPVHVLVILLKRLHRIPVDAEFHENILDGGLATTLPHVVAKELGGCSPESRDARASRGRDLSTTRGAPRSPERHVRDNTRDRERTTCVGHTSPAGVDRSVPKYFFQRRTSVLTLAFGSPKTPRTVGCAGENPETRKRPTVAPVAWLNRPHKRDARFKHPAKCLSIDIPATSSHDYGLGLVTHLFDGLWNVAAC